MRVASAIVFSRGEVFNTAGFRLLNWFDPSVLKSLQKMIDP